MTQVNFNAEEHPQDTDFEPLPEGWYRMMLEKTEMKPTKNGDGKRLSCTMSVLAGDFDGRKVFEGFNFENPNHEAVKISMRQFGSLVRACGKVAVAEAEELLGIPFLAKLKIRPADGTYDASNRIVQYKPDDAHAPVAEPKAAGGKPGVAPWGR